MNLQTTLNIKELKSLNDACITDLINNLQVKLSSNDDDVLRSLNVELEYLRDFKTEIEDFACASDAYFKYQEAYEEKEKLRKELVRSNEKIRNMELEHNVKVAELKALRISAENQLEETKQELKKSKSKLVNMYKRPLNNNNNSITINNLPTDSKPKPVLSRVNLKPSSEYEFDDDSFSLYGSNFDTIFEDAFKPKTPQRKQEPSSNFQTPNNSFRIEENRASTPRKKIENQQNIESELSNVLAFTKKNYPNLNITQKLEELFNEVANNHEQTYLLKPTDKVDLKDFTFNSSKTSTSCDDSKVLLPNYEEIAIQTDPQINENIEKMDFEKIVSQIEAQFSDRISLQENEFNLRLKDNEEKIQHLNIEYEAVSRDRNLLNDEVNFLKNKLKSMESFIDEQVQERDRERSQLNKYETEITSMKLKNNELTIRCEELTKLNKTNDLSSSQDNPTMKISHDNNTTQNNKNIEINRPTIQKQNDSNRYFNEACNSSIVENDVEKYTKVPENDRSMTPDSLTDGRIEDMQSDDEIAEGAITSDSDSFNSNDDVNFDKKNTTTFSLKQENLLQSVNNSNNNLIQLTRKEVDAYHEEIKTLRDQNKFLYNEIMKMNKEHMDLQKDFDEVQTLLDRESNRVEQLLSEKKRPDTIEERDEDLFMLNEAKQNLETQLASIQDELAFYKARFSHNTATTTTCSTDSGLITVENSKPKYSDDPDSPQNSVKSPDLLEQISLMQRQYNEVVSEKFDLTRELEIAVEEVKSLRLHCEVEKNRANSQAVEANLSRQKCQELSEMLNSLQSRLEKLNHENEYLRRKLEEESIADQKSNHGVEIQTSNLNNASNFSDLQLESLQESINNFKIHSKTFEESYKSIQQALTEVMLNSSSHQLSRDSINTSSQMDTSRQLMNRQYSSPNSSSMDTLAYNNNNNIILHQKSNFPQSADKMTMTDSNLNSNLSIKDEQYYRTVIRMNKLMSMNRSLAYQKSFLIWQIGNFVEEEKVVLYRISRPLQPRNNKNRFRVISFVIISLKRMCILQRRWKNRNVHSISRSSAPRNSEVRTNHSDILVSTPNTTPMSEIKSIKGHRDVNNSSLKKSPSLMITEKTRVNERKSLSTSQRYQSYQNPKSPQKSPSNRLLTPTASSSAKVTTGAINKSTRNQPKRLSQENSRIFSNKTQS